MTAVNADAIAKAGKLNDRAFVLAVFGLFLPFVGIVMGPLDRVLDSGARRRAREVGGVVEGTPLVFGIVVTVVWTVLWLFVLVPALLN